MKIQFCDVCNESVPVADVDEGRAVLRNGRVVCARCEAAMSASAALGSIAPAPQAAVELIVAPPRVLHPPPSLVPPAPRTASGAPLAVALAIVALLAALGGGFFLFDRLERRTRELEDELARVGASIDERARLASSGLANEMRAANEGFGEVRGSVGDLERRLDESAKERAAAHDALRAEVEQLSARMVAIDTVESALERHETELEDLTRLGSTLRAELDGVSDRMDEPVAAADPAADPAAASAPGAADAPAWVSWLADLSSPDSGTRWQAVQSLGATGDPSVATHLLPMLGDSDIFVRMAAARILGELGAVDAIPGLIDALEDPEMSVREQAFVSLRKVSGQSLPFDPDGKDVDRAKRVKAWREWWDRARDELTSAKERRPS